MKKLLCLILACTFFFIGCNKSNDIKEGTATTEKENESKTEVTEENSTSEETDKRLVYAIWNTPNGIFNPLISNIQQDGYVNSIVYNSLLEQNNKGELENSLAKSFEINEDATEVKITLRDDVYWSDGEKFSADDVVFTFESLANKDYTGEYYNRVENIVGASEVKDGTKENIEGITVDNDTITIKFTQSFAPSKTLLGTTPILPKHIWSKTEVKNWENETELLNKPVGTGAFIVKDFKSGVGVYFERNEKYFKGVPKLKYIDMLVFNADTAPAELINKNIDIAEISNFNQDDIAQLKNAGIQITSYPTSNIQYMGMNNQNEILKIKEVRQAFAYAIDRQAIVDNLLEGHGLVINTPMVPTLWSYPDNLINYSKDLDKAKELLASAGLKDNDNDGFVEYNGKKVSFTLVVPLGNKTRELTGPIIKSELEQIGIEIILDQKEFPAVMEQVVEKREYDMYLMANTLDLDPDPKPNWYSTASWNFVGYINPKTDELIDAGLKAATQDERKAIYNEFGKILNEDLPWLPLYAPDVMCAFQENITNYEPNTFAEFYNIENWDK